MKRLMVSILLCVQLPNTAMSMHMDKMLFLEIASIGDATEQKLLGLYLKGLLHGLETSNMALLKQGNKPLYCTPQTTILTTDWLIENLLEYLERYPLIPDSMSIGILAYYAIREQFQCTRDIRN